MLFIKMTWLYRGMIAFIVWDTGFPFFFLWPPENMAHNVQEAKTDEGSNIMQSRMNVQAVAINKLIINVTAFGLEDLGMFKSKLMINGVDYYKGGRGIGVVDIDLDELTKALYGNKNEYYM